MESQKKTKESLMPKLIFIGGLMLLLSLILTLFSEIVYERKGRRNSAAQEVSRKWGQAQNFVGPVLVVPYLKRLTQKNRSQNNGDQLNTGHLYFLPNTLKIDGKVIPKKRARGLYEVMLYILNLKVSGNFTFPSIKGMRINARRILWEEAYLAVGIPDTRGIQKKLLLTINKKTITFKPGTKECDLFDSGIHAGIPNLRNMRGKKIAFKFSCKIKGSEALAFAPLGKGTEVSLSSSWPHPSFDGAYLPTSRTISKNGFKANWEISHFGRNYPQRWSSHSRYKQKINNSFFGLKIYTPVDFYQKSVRAVKYGILFILLTFLVVFLFELFAGLKIHPMQYLFVGLALCLFYLLFPSLSEHLNFIFSYILSSLAVLFLINSYSIAVLKKRARAAILAIFIGILYGFLFVLLENQDYALLMGAILLSIVLGIVMYITRNIDWYNIQANGINPPVKQ